MTTSSGPSWTSCYTNSEEQPAHQHILSWLYQPTNFILTTTWHQRKKHLNK